MYIHSGPDLYLTADRATVVEEGDPRAAFVLVVNGGQLPEAEAERYGLTKKGTAAPDEEKAAPPPDNKAKAAPPSNKAKG